MTFWYARQVPKVLVAGLVLASACLLTGLGCNATPGPSPTPTPTATPTPGPAQTFPTSLHAARTGKRTFYEGTAQDPGFFSLTNIDYDSLSCKGCHAPTLADGTPIDSETYQPGCADCHVDPTDFSIPVAESICLACHGRESAVRSLAANADFPFAQSLSDVHQDRGMVCMDCHSAAEMHGTGTQYNSLLAADAPRPRCENCHVEGGSAPAPPTSVTAHAIHMENVDCSACHVQSVISCFSCHFETEVQLDFKRFFGPPPRAGFVFLVNRTTTGKVSTASFQSLTYDGKAFAAFAPAFAHTVAHEARDCSDCHNNAAVQSYANDGFIEVVSYDNGSLSGPSGVIPIPPDWKDPDVFRIDYVTYTPSDLSPTDPPFMPGNWEELNPTEELRQMLPEFSTPLTAEQMQRLQTPVGG